MANRRIPSVWIDYEEIHKAMEQKGISIRGLAKRIGVSDRRLREYFERASCPPYILGKICQEVPISVKNALKENSIWMRIGVRVPVTEEELTVLMLERNELGTDVDIHEHQANEFLKRAVVDDDSYIPYSCLEDGFVIKERSDIQGTFAR